jgi:hypothetical protein
MAFEHLHPSCRRNTLHDSTEFSRLCATHRGRYERTAEVEGPSTGEDLAVMVDKIATTPPAVAQRLVTLFNNYKNAR